MGKKDKNKKKGKGAEKTSLKTDKKLQAKQKKLLEKLGEVIPPCRSGSCLKYLLQFSDRYCGGCC